MFLPATEKKFFDEFWVFANKGNYYDEQVKALTYQILFGEFYGKETKYNCVVTCNKCSMYNKDRCVGMVSDNRYGDNYKSESNTQVAAADFYYWEQTNPRLLRYMSDLCLRLGTYRVKKFQEHIYNKAQESILLHNKLNPKHKKEELKEQSVTYFSSQDVMQLDVWFKFKNETIEGSYLCSLLSDF
jgi:hypothetical protein